MGYRLSKSSGNRASETTTTTTATRSTPSLEQQQLGRTHRPNSLPPAINLHLQEEPISSAHPRQDLEESLTSSLSSSYSLMNASNASAASSNSHRQIIIKIQLAKMVNDNETAQQQQPQEAVAGEEYGYVGWESSANEAAGSFTSVANNNNNNGNKQEQTSSSTTATATTTTTTYPLISQLSLERESRRRIAAETDEESGVLLRHPGYSAMLEAPEYIDVLEEAETTITATPTTTPTNGNVAPATSSVCCRCQKSKRRCCKCTCLVAFRRMLEPSSSSSATSSSKTSKANKLLPQERKHSTKAVQLRVAATQRSSVPAPSNQVAIWASDRASMGAVNPTAAATATNSPPPFNPQILVVQCPPRTSLVTVASTDDTIHVLATTHACDSNANNTAPMATATSLVASTGGSTATSLVASTGATTAANRLPAASQGPIVHSQVDFVHYLVPDLEKITNASYYWGKMDRYEAERLLEGKPEGTFLLRDSAQEEFLFSVTFRKYGRSLHARIEQSGHKFSFDCHDPHVFNALTVTGLLEHYKDPACVMFFEPMLTIPLHRHRPFSLQQLCRATIVSHTSYDGISDMELPSRLKGYLKEYHYKQKLRVKPFDEPFYTTRT